MFDSRKRTKIKNNKIQAWRLELGSFSYTVEYRPGKDNVAPDLFTRAFSASMSSNNLEEIHIGLCHPGVTRMFLDQSVFRVYKVISNNLDKSNKWNPDSNQHNHLLGKCLYFIKLATIQLTLVIYFY